MLCRKEAEILGAFKKRRAASNIALFVTPHGIIIRPRQNQSSCSSVQWIFNQICRYTHTFCVIIGEKIAYISHDAHLYGCVVGIATRYGLDGPGIDSRSEARFSVPVQTGPGARPASCIRGTGSFPGVKRSGRGIDHPPKSINDVKKERVQLHLYSPLVDSGSVKGEITSRL